MVDCLDLSPDDRVLEIGFGPGVGIEYAATAVPTGFVAGVDVSKEMIQQACKRNASAIADGRVELHDALAESLSFDDDTFDAAFSVNSYPLWDDQGTGLRELARTLKPGGTVAVAFTPFVNQHVDEVPDRLSAAGFESVRVVESDHGTCILGQA